MILLPQKISAAGDNMDGSFVSLTLGYGIIDEGTISHTQEDTMVLATSYMTYKIGKIVNILLIFCSLTYNKCQFCIARIAFKWDERLVLKIKVELLDYIFQFM